MKKLFAFALLAPIAIALVASPAVAKGSGGKAKEEASGPIAPLAALGCLLSANTREGCQPKAAKAEKAGKKDGKKSAKASKSGGKKKAKG